MPAIHRQHCARHISVYNAAGNFQRNPQNSYTLNSLTAKRDDNGSIAVQFGDCEGAVSNCLPITTGWNYMVRLYKPRAEVLNGSWRIPELRLSGNRRESAFDLHRQEGGLNPSLERMRDIQSADTSADPRQSSVQSVILFT